MSSSIVSSVSSSNSDCSDSSDIDSKIDEKSVNKLIGTQIDKVVFYRKMLNPYLKSLHVRKLHSTISTWMSNPHTEWAISEFKSIVRDLILSYFYKKLKKCIREGRYIEIDKYAKVYFSSSTGSNPSQDLVNIFKIIYGDKPDIEACRDLNNYLLIKMELFIFYIRKQDNMHVVSDLYVKEMIARFSELRFSELDDLSGNNLEAYIKNKHAFGPLYQKICNSFLEYGKCFNSLPLSTPPTSNLSQAYFLIGSGKKYIILEDYIISYLFGKKVEVKKEIEDKKENEVQKEIDK